MQHMEPLSVLLCGWEQNLSLLAGTPKEGGKGRGEPVILTAADWIVAEPIWQSVVSKSMLLPIKR